MEGEAGQVGRLEDQARAERHVAPGNADLLEREVAAWELSRALGWAVVPPTVLREGPFGEGSLQEFVQADFTEHYFTLREVETHQGRLQRICAFDLLANNADRKSGHCLLGPDKTVYAIDNGLCFNVEPKLRTVIWEFANEPLPAEVTTSLRTLARRGVPKALTRLLAPAECEALLARARSLLEAGRFPDPSEAFGYPWPVV